MAISITWGTKVINVPQADLTLISGNLYELDVNAFRLALKDLEDSDEGMAFPTTHSHNTEVSLSGVTYARTLQIINGYTITFEDTGSPYTVRCVGANHNLADVTNYVSEVSLVIGNAAGLITVTSGSGVTAQDKTDIINGVFTRLLESGLTFEQAARIMLAAVSGRSTGVGTTNEKYKSVDGTVDRIDVTFDGSFNRDTVTLNGS